MKGGYNATAEVFLTSDTDSQLLTGHALSLVLFIYRIHNSGQNGRSGQCCLLPGEFHPAARCPMRVRNSPGTGLAVADTGGRG
jgi:hypothetical protein